MKKILVSILISGLLVNPFLVLGQYGNANDQGQKFELSQKINSDLQIKNQMDLGLAAKTNASAIKNKANADLQKQNYVPGEILVKFKSSKVNLQTAGGRTAALNFSHAKLLEKKEDLGKNNISVLTIKDAKTVEQKITELKNDPNVEYAEPNYKRYPAIIDTDDTYKTNLWGLDNIGQTVNTVTGINDADIDAPEAWAINEGANGQIIVAVIDSGVAYNHPDLVANMWDGSNCKDEDGNVLGGCQHGFDYEDNDKMPLPTSSSHGMYIAGTIAAAKNNDKGIIGVAPNARIMAIKFGLDIASEIKAIDFAIQNGAKIINASFGGDTFSQFEYDAINRFKSAGGIFVAAAGNGGLDQIGDNNENTHHYPSDYNLDNIISVAATDQNDNLAPFSNYGANSIDVAAPGTNIYSTIADSPVMFENFESIATPDVPSGWIKGGTNNKWATYNFNDNVWGKVMYGQVPSFPYDNNANTTITSPTYDLIAGEASMDFWTKCDTEYITTGWADYMQLEYSADGVNFFPAIDPFFGEEFRWDEPTLDLLNGENPLNNTNGSIFHYENVSIPAQYLTNNFKFQFRWVTNASDNNYDGCLVDDIKITKFSDGSDEKYGYANGTSMAAPHVAGLAALIWGYRPDLTLPQVRDVILNTGDLLPSLDGKTFTGKRINAQKALQSVAPISLTSIAIATPATKLTYAVGDSLDISGLTVIGTYSDNSTTTETITATNITGFDSSVPAIGQILTITVGEKTTTYAIDVVAPISSAKAITSFQFAGLNPVVVGAINEIDHSIVLTVPNGTDVTALAPTIVVSENATSNPATGAAQNFTNPITYTITAQNGSTQNYIVSVTIAALAVDFSNLTAIIASAQSLHDGAVEGTMPGQYAAGSKSTLQTAITTAQEVKNNPAATQTEIDSATATLTTAVNAFEGGKVAPDTIAPVIILNGENPINIHVGDSYSDPGATASDNVDGNITANIVVAGLPINTTAPGTFTVTYNVSDGAGNSATQITRTVNVVDVSTPVITLIGNNPVAAELGAVYVDAGATAFDDADGDITDHIIVVNNVNSSVSGAYTVTYDVSDSSGNSAPQVIRTVNVADTTIPVITLLGTSPVNINVGDTYTDVGAIATDNTDGDITANIAVANPVDTNIAGAYTITYNVSDAAGNHATQITRVVNVIGAAITLSGIAITAPATKLSYIVGDLLDISGLVVTGTYSDSSTAIEAITANNITGFDSATPATGQVLTITVDGKTTTYTVNIIAAPVVTPIVSSGGGGGGGGGSTAITVNKNEPQVMGASTEKIATTEGAEKPISQMTRAEKLEKIAEIRLLLIQLIQQLIAELQKQLLATGK